MVCRGEIKSGFYSKCKVTLLANTFYSNDRFFYSMKTIGDLSYSSFFLRARLNWLCIIRYLYYRGNCRNIWELKNDRVCMHTCLCACLCASPCVLQSVYSLYTPSIACSPLSTNDHLPTTSDWMCFLCPCFRGTCFNYSVSSNSHVLLLFTLKVEEV